MNTDISDHVAELSAASTKPRVSLKYFGPYFGGSTRKAVLIFPGGGYQMLSEEKEGEEYARVLAAAGIHAFVVRYRLAVDGFHHPAMLEDALAALAFAQLHAREFGFDPGQIGLMGSSAGGHLAGHLATSPEEWDRYELRAPAFAILCYPVISMDIDAHTRSRDNLLGPDMDPANFSQFSIQRRVHPRMPRTYLMHMVDDPAVKVENSLLMANALQEAQIPFELHIYEKGGHGTGMRTLFPWKDDVIRFILQTVGA